MRIIIAGSREFIDFETLCKYCDHVLKNTTVECIVSGTANGADKLGERYAKEREYKLVKFPADWSRHKKSAGHIRNAEMADYSNALIAFNMGTKGTNSMISIATSKGLKVRVKNI